MGRVATFGELYDARNEQFLRVSLVNGNFTSLIQSTQNRYSNLKYMEENTLTEKLESLDVQAGLKLSVMFGFVEISGSGQYIKDKQQSSKSAKVSVANLVITEFEQIDFASVDGRKYIDLDILEKLDATHVVVGIQWGGNVIVSVEDFNSENKDKEVIKGSLSGKLKALVATISVNGEVGVSEEEKNEMNKFNFDLYGDILPTTVPTTIAGAIDLMTSVPKMLTEGNNGKGKALSYTMLPIALFRELLNIETDANFFVAYIDELTISSCVKLFEQMNDVELKVNDLMVEMNNYKNYISKDKIDKISRFANSFQLYQFELKRRLSEQLILIKSGNETVDKLMEVLDEAYAHKLSPYNIDFDQFLSIQTGFKFVDHLTDLQVNVLDKTTSFNEFMSKHWNQTIYAFFYSEEFPLLSDESMIAFREILDAKETFDPTSIFVAIKIDVLGDVERDVYFNFDAPNKLRLFESGICEIDDYLSILNYIRSQFQHIVISKKIIFIFL